MCKRSLLVVKVPTAGINASQYTVVKKACRMVTPFYEMPFPPPVNVLDFLGGDADVDGVVEDNALHTQDGALNKVVNYCYRRYQREKLSRLLYTSYLVAIRPLNTARKTRGIACVKTQTKARLGSLVSCEERRQRYIYKCGCQGRETVISFLRHTQIRQGRVSVCKVCKEILVYSHAVKPMAGKTYLLPYKKSVSQVLQR